jgi:malonate transporter and related proteins
MFEILNLALPYFGLIFIGFACGKAKGLPEQGLAWMNFFLLYVSLPALLFVIMSKTPFAELNNPPLPIATTLGTASAFVLALVAGRLVGRLSFREATLAGLSGSFGNIGYMGPGLALAVLGIKAAAPTALIFCCDSSFLFTIVPLLIAFTDSKQQSLLHTLGVVVRQIAFNPLIMSACAGACAAALHIHLPVAIYNTLLFLQNAAAPMALFVPGVTVALRPLGRMPWEVARRHRGKTPDPSACRFRIDAAAGAFRAALGGDRGPDGVAAAGAECVRDRAAERQLDRARIRRRADRDLRIRHHAHQRDVVDPDRPAGVSVKPS